jgi:hypothetical protein
MKAESAIRKIQPRLPDWPTRLSAFLDSRSCEPFAWGVNDHLLFAVAAIEAITGEHPAPHLVGAYDSAVGACVLGIDPTPADRFGVLGWPPTVGLTTIPVALAWRGDVVAVRSDHAHVVLGIVVGEFVAMPGVTAVVHRARGLALAAWRV